MVSKSRSQVKGDLRQGHEIVRVGVKLMNARVRKVSSRSAGFYASYLRKPRGGCSPPPPYRRGLRGRGVSHGSSYLRSLLRSEMRNHKTWLTAGLKREIRKHGYSSLISSTIKKSSSGSPPMMTAWSGSSLRDRVRLLCAARHGAAGGKAGDASERRRSDVPGITCHHAARRSVPPTLPIVT